MSSGRVVIGTSLFFVLVCSATSALASSVMGLVPEHFPSGIPAPVVVPVPAGVAREAILGGKLEIDGRGVGDVVLQVEPADAVAGTPARAWFLWTAQPEQIGKPIAVRLKPGQADAAQPAAYRVRHQDPLVNVVDPRDKLVLAYRHGAPDPALRWPMTSYIHPLVGLDGEILTDRSPGDHFHHRGLFWAWVRIMRGDKPLGETWIPRNIDVTPADLDTSQGPVLGRFSARHYWVHRPGFPAEPAADARDTSASDRLFQEDVVCRVFKTTDEGRVIDLDLTLTALQDDLRMGGQTQGNKGYGGVTLRFSTEQQGKAKEPQVVADGRRIMEHTVNRLKALWVDWTGIFHGPDGQALPHRSGAALFVHPSHPPLPKSPPEWITRFYGPINPAYPGLEMLDIPRDKPLRLKYRIWIHRGDAAEANVDAHYRAYAADWKWKVQ